MPRMTEKERQENLRQLSKDKQQAKNPAPTKPRGRCPMCGDPLPLYTSCYCFDNHCQ